jgi:hypothetical protein
VHLIAETKPNFNSFFGTAILLFAKQPGSKSLGYLTKKTKISNSEQETENRAKGQMRKKQDKHRERISHIFTPQRVTQNSKNTGSMSPTIKKTFRVPLDLAFGVAPKRAQNN